MLSTRNNLHKNIRKVVSGVNWWDICMYSYSIIITVIKALRRMKSLYFLSLYKKRYLLISEIQTSPKQYPLFEHKRNIISVKSNYRVLIMHIWSILADQVTRCCLKISKISFAFSLLTKIHISNVHMVHFFSHVRL